ncbi:hypothetical protein LINPERHAP1_LOCUS4176 [Linum perenne]
MAPFIFKSDNHFVASSDGTTLQVYELTKPLIHPSSIRNTHWNEVAKINIGLRHDTNEGISYNGLLFFDGHGRIEGRATLTTLAHHLMLLRLRVSPEGYCFQDADFGIHYLFLNDLFCWPRHGVELVTITNWHRWDLEYHYRPRNDEELQKLRKEKEEELKKKKQLDECRKNSWAYSSVSALLPTNSDGERKHQARRRQVPPEKFNRQELSYNFYIENIPNLTTGNNVNVYHTLYCVDDDDITEWRPPSTISIYVSKGGTGGFDVSNWWFTKATHPEGGLTMLAYYDGSHSNAPHANGPIPLPFSKDLKSIVPAQNFFMADLKPIGVRMAFAYRW